MAARLLAAVSPFWRPWAPDATTNTLAHAEQKPWGDLADGYLLAGIRYCMFEQAARRVCFGDGGVGVQSAEKPWTETSCNDQLLNRDPKRAPPNVF